MKKNMKFIIAILLGVFMNDSVTSKTKLENFDDLFVGSPADIEKNMASLLPEAKNKAEEALKGATQKEELEQAQAALVEAAARYNAVKKLKGKK